MKRVSIALCFGCLLAALPVGAVAKTKHDHPPLKADAVAPGAAEAPADDKLTERYTAGLGATTDALERVIAAQANQINVFTVMAAILGLLLTAAGFGLFRSVQQTVRDAVDNRVADLVSHGIDESNARSAKLYEVFIRTVAETAKDLVSNRQSDLLARIRDGTLDISQNDGVRRLITLQSELLIGPMNTVATMFTLAAGQKSASELHEACWVLYAEVAAEHVSPRAMLQLVMALTNVLQHRKFDPAIITDLRKFAEQLRKAIDSGELPTEPDF